VGDTSKLLAESLPDVGRDLDSTGTLRYRCLQAEC